MLNLVTISQLTALAAMLISFFGNDKNGRLTFNIAFAVCLVLSTIKYYFGPDIITYVPFYENLSPIYEISTEELESIYFENGFIVFCSLLKTFGFSYWGMTAVINVLLMHSLYKVLSLFPKYQSVGLYFMIAFSGDILFHQLRQALAIAFFFYTIVILAKKECHQFLLLLTSIIGCTFHNSAFFVFVPLLIFSYFGKCPTRISRTAFAVMAIVFVVMLPFDIVDPLKKAVGSLGFSDSFSSSITFHFGGAKPLRSILIIYVFLILVMSLIKDKRNDKPTLTFRVVSFIGLIFIACFYRYPFFINRMQGYFLAICSCYVLDLLNYCFLNDATARHLLHKQLCALTIIIFLVYTNLHLLTGNSQQPSYYESMPTVFDALSKTDSEKKFIKSKQIEVANFFWNNEWKKDNKKSLENFSFFKNALGIE